MRELLGEVLELQSDWSRANSPEMERRGRIVRTDLPDFVRAILAPNKEKDGLDFRVQGKDGEGNKSRVPWVRIFSERHSPSPTRGWYCVFLFNAEGEAVYLCISHGSFERTGPKEVHPRSPKKLAALMQWARSVLGEAPERLGMTTAIDLGTDAKTGDQYRLSTVAGFKYDRAALPSNKEVVRDIFAALRLLRKLYDAEDLGLTPGAEAPDVAAIQAHIEDISSGGRQSGQGFGLTVEERRAVELRAMAVARSHLKGLGFRLKDTSRNRPYDFEGLKGGQSFIVEVKGTTGALGSVVLTHTEVAAHRDWHPRNILIIVHAIQLINRSASPKARGGEIHFVSPWDINLGTLEPMAFKYTLPAK